MVDVSVIVPRIGRQSLEGFEITDNFSDASGEYLYIKNTDAKLDAESLEIDGDLSALNPKKDYEDASENFTENFDEIFTDVFKADFGFAFNLMQKLKWDVLIKKDKIEEFYGPGPADIKEALDTYNGIFKRFVDNDYMSQYKECIYDVMMEELVKVYEKNPQEESYDLMKEDFTQMVYHWRFTEFSVNTTKLNKLFFDNIVYTKTYDEFRQLMEEYYIKVEIDHMKEDIKALKIENETIKKKTAYLNKINREILNSNSWKLTKPLRNMR